VANDSKQRKEEQGTSPVGPDVLAVTARGQPNRRFGRQPNERSEAGVLVAEHHDRPGETRSWRQRFGCVQRKLPVCNQMLRSGVNHFVRRDARRGDGQGGALADKCVDARVAARRRARRSVGVVEAGGVVVGVGEAAVEVVEQPSSERETFEPKQRDPASAPSTKSTNASKERMLRQNALHSLAFLARERRSDRATRKKDLRRLHGNVNGNDMIRPIPTRLTPSYD
jgi:hypothetical protein